MNKLRRLILLLILVLSGMFMTKAWADGPLDNPPPPPGGHGSGGNQQGAPIEGGLGIILSLGAAYGAFRLYKSRKILPESSE